MKKDKERVQDEVWTEARIRSFLNLQPPAGVNADYHRLQRAYQSMREIAFTCLGFALPFDSFMI